MASVVQRRLRQMEIQVQNSEDEVYMKTRDGTILAVMVTNMMGSITVFKYSQIDICSRVLTKTILKIKEMMEDAIERKKAVSGANVPHLNKIYAKTTASNWLPPTVISYHFSFPVADTAVVNGMPIQSIKPIISINLQNSTACVGTSFNQISSMAGASMKTGKTKRNNR